MPDSCVKSNQKHLKQDNDYFICHHMSIYVIKNTMRFKSDKYKTKIILNKNKNKMLEQSDTSLKFK